MLSLGVGINLTLIMINERIEVRTNRVVLLVSFYIFLGLSLFTLFADDTKFDDMPIYVGFTFTCLFLYIVLKKTTPLIIIDNSGIQMCNYGQKGATIHLPWREIERASANLLLCRIHVKYPTKYTDSNLVLFRNDWKFGSPFVFTFIQSDMRLSKLASIINQRAAEINEKESRENL